MTTEQLIEVLTRNLRDLLMNESILVEMDTRRADVPGWDSFTNVNLIVAIEVELGIKFNVADIESFDTAGDIVNAARALLN
jgi:acyl carrier protein